MIAARAGQPGILEPPGAPDVRAALRIDVAGLRAERHRRHPHQRNRRAGRHDGVTVNRGRGEAAAVELERRRHLVAPEGAVGQDALGPDRVRLGRRRVQECVLRHRPLFDRQERLARLPVEQEEVAVGPDGRQRLARPPVDLRLVEQHRRGDVRVPDVVPDHLVVPAPLACRHVEREHRGGEQVVARADLAAEHRDRIARGEVDQTQVRIDRPVQPDAAAAEHPGVRILRPRVVTELARPRHDEERPLHRAGRRVEGDDAPLPAAVAVRQPHEDLPACIQRRGGDRFAALQRHAADRRGPHQLARVLAQRRHLRVTQSEKDEAVAQPDALPGRNHLRAVVVRLPAPDHLARPGVDREHVGPGRQIEDAVLDDRGRPRRRAALEVRHPGPAEPADRGGRDVGEGRVARARPVPADGRPVLRRIAAATLGGLPLQTPRQ